MNFKHISVLNKEESQKIKGGYLFTCEEKKRGLMMKITTLTDSGTLIDTYKVPVISATSFMTTYRVGV